MCDKEQKIVNTQTDKFENLNAEHEAHMENYQESNGSDNSAKNEDSEHEEDTNNGDSKSKPALTANYPDHLTDEQKERLENAKAYARELQDTVFKDVKIATDPALPVGILNPGLSSGVDPRSLSVLSRIYVGSINFEMTDDHIRQVFGEFGAVKSISMSVDSMTGRHKGFGFVEYDVPEAASLAMETMNGAMMGGSSKVDGFTLPPEERVYISNINEQVSELDIKTILSPFGNVAKCVLAPDMLTRKHKGWGFVEFDNRESAKTAAQTMNGFKLGNQLMRVRVCVVGGPLGDGMAALEKLPQPNLSKMSLPNEVLSVAESINSSLGATTTTPAVLTQSPQTAQPANVGSVDDSVVDDDDDIKINSKQRQRIMQQLSRGGERSTVVCLSNIANPEELDSELITDISDECSKYGSIVKVVGHISKPHEMESEYDVVKIFIKYETGEDVEKAITSLNKRWFGGKQIQAKSYDEDKYRSETSADTIIYIPE
ncbi:hypothetical protein H4219_000947 [Mycoemilia scoparia]|uniref:RRM domain-containing protein n=1 Tax=Mycoemilia scoparia TaxID=417184 RepID=A0A9W8DWS8_9FUNG|nr:hypothetical protein H4219_000947 [Mycoemilia scoparia]